MNNQDLYIWNNPDFNEVIIFYGLEAISFRNTKKAIELRKKMQAVLQEIDCQNWPYKTSIMVTIGISGPTKMYSRRDVDNMCKVILDAGNKIIYNDDKFINLLIIEKQLWDRPLYGFQVGIRSISPTKKDKYSPTTCFTSDRNGVPSQEEISRKKIMSPLFLEFETRPDGEYVRVLRNSTK